MKSIWIIAALAISASGQAWAVRVLGVVAPPPDAVRQAVLPSSASQADDSSSMREGVITGVSDKHDQVEINGSWLKVVDGRTQVIRQGRAVKRDDLAKGQKVRFTLAPGVADRLTLGAVYVP